MTLEKAIEINNLSEKGAYVGSYGDLHGAMKLGIEALKRIRESRQHTDVGFHYLLPGETEEG